MIENIPLKPIPLPHYNGYQTDLCTRHSLVLPLKEVPFSLKGNLFRIPQPLHKGKMGWPWTVESDVKFLNKNECPKVSVVIPSYQQGTFIEEALRSILLQNYPNIELIIMDGGSNDETINVLEHYKNYLSVAISEKDRGQSHAVNKGFSIASGELYYWLNSDDYMNLNSLNNIVPHFSRDAELDIVYGHGLIVNNEASNIKLDYAPRVLERYLRFGGIVLSHSVIWRKRVHCPVWEDLQCAMDAELWLRLFTGKKSKHSHFPIGVFRKHPQQKTSTSSNWAKQWNEDFDNFIWKYYPPISKAIWQYRTHEYRLIQKIYRLFYPFRLIKSR